MYYRFLCQWISQHLHRLRLQQRHARWALAFESTERHTNYLTPKTRHFDVTVALPHTKLQYIYETRTFIPPDATNVTPTNLSRRGWYFSTCRETLIVFLANIHSSANTLGISQSPRHQKVITTNIRRVSTDITDKMYHNTQ